MKDFMTYDEIHLSAFLQVSSPVRPINEGNRRNQGREDDVHIEDAIYIGAVGARFAKKEQMDWKCIINTPEQNIPQKGYGPVEDRQPHLNDVFAKFYGKPHFSCFDSALPPFDKDVYKKRMRITIDTFLEEAKARGREAGKRVYLFVVGIGLGCWMKEPAIQTKVYLEAWKEALTELESSNIDVVEFEFIDNEIDLKSTPSIEVLFK